MSRLSRYAGDPRTIVVRFLGRCKCGVTIQPGVRAFFYPKGKSLHSFECGNGCGQAAQADFESCAMDELTYAGGRI